MIQWVMKRPLLLCVLGFGLLLIIMGSLSERTHKAGQFSNAAVSTVNDQAETFLEDVVAVSSRAGARQWTLQTAEAVISPEGDHAQLMSVSVTLPEDGPSGALDAVSDRGTYSFDSNDLYLIGNVVARTAGMSLHTDQAMIVASGLHGTEVVTESDVLVQQGDITLTGTGLRATKEGVRILNNVRAVFP